MNDYFALLTVRSSSTRLPRKCWLELGGMPVVEFVVQKCESNSITPIICTTSTPADQEFEAYFKKSKVKVFRGDAKNKLKRWLECAQNLDLKDFHTLDVDDPLFDPNAVKESLNLLRSKNLDVVGPTDASSKGAASVGYSISNFFLKSHTKLISNALEIEMVDSFFKRIEDIKFESLKLSRDELTNVRLTLDYLEDYQLIKKIIEVLGVNANRTQIELYLRENPKLIAINWFRNSEWQINQDKIRNEEASVKNV